MGLRTLLIVGVASAALSGLGSGVLTYRYVHAQWNVEKLSAARDALEAARKIEQERAAETARRDEEARNLDAEHAKNVAAIVAAADGAAADYTRRLWALQGRVNSCRAAAEAVDTGSVAGSSTGGEDRLASAYGAELAAIGRDAAKLAATVKTCVEWASGVGR